MSATLGFKVVCGTYVIYINIYIYIYIYIFLWERQREFYCICEIEGTSGIRACIIQQGSSLIQATESAMLDACFANVWAGMSYFGIR